jgi:7,8-dihydropterin-6-yl-methyl-4-(beta-D-ribofuranosyl)aminobenzene 5'-phosphate synthase
MKISILVEDTKKDAKFEAEHDLSVYFEKDGKKFLLDLGQSDMFLRNAKELNINLDEINYIIFSHGHYDHTRGLPYFPIKDNLKIIAHPDCLLPKFQGDRYIGFPKDLDNLTIELKEKPAKLTSNVHFLGQIPGERRHSLGEYIKKGIKHTDFLLDDSALAIIEGNKLIVLAGCAHSNIINIVRYAKGLFKAKEVILIGGFHMLDYSDKEIEETMIELKKLGVKKIFPGHCTGKKAIEMLLGSFEGERIYSGKIIEV